MYIPCKHCNVVTTVLHQPTGYIEDTQKPNYTPVRVFIILPYIIILVR